MERFNRSFIYKQTKMATHGIAVRFSVLNTVLLAVDVTMGRWGKNFGPEQRDPWRYGRYVEVKQM